MIGEQLEPEEKNIKLMTYINPFLCDDAAQKKDHRRNLFEEAARSGYLVKNQDGEPYKITISSFSAALVDLTNPEAWNWIKDIIKEELISSGASGWMADFGDGLPYDAVLFSGADPKSYNDRYAEEWARVNREAISEAGAKISSSSTAQVTQRVPVTAPYSGSETSSSTGMSTTASRAPSRACSPAGSRAIACSTPTSVATLP